MIIPRILIPQFANNRNSSRFEDKYVLLPIAELPRSFASGSLTAAATKVPFFPTKVPFFPAWCLPADIHGADQKDRGRWRQALVTIERELYFWE